MIALEVGGIYKNGRGDYFVVVNASFDLWLDQYGEAYKANGQMHSHTHDSQANLIAEADVSEVCKAHNALTERMATGTTQATECETNGIEGLRAELDAAKRALAEAKHIGNEYADAATNGVQWLRNIIDGISAPSEALQEMQSNLKRIAALAAESTKTDLPFAKTSEPVPERNPNDGRWG